MAAPRPFCACGCGQRVRLSRHRWLVGHIPRAQILAQRAEANRSMVYRVRARRFNRDLDRLGKSVTREDLLALMSMVYERGYQAGYHTARKEQRRAA